jgi:ferric-dicitrate binding protein FerR (iron transport regulator)
MTDERHDELAGGERRIRDAIRSSGEVRADPAFRERLKRQFSDGTISQAAGRREPAAPRGLPRWGWLFVPAAAVVVLLVVLLLPDPAPYWTVYGHGQVEIDGEVYSLDRPQLITRALEDGGEIHVLEASSLDLRLDDRLILALVEGTEATVPAPLSRGSESPLAYEVRHGELRIKTGPEFPGAELRVFTPESLTEIVGTIVSVYKGDGYTCVCVLEGTAMIGIDEADLEAIPEGMLKFMFDDGSEPMIMEISPDHRAGLLEFNEQYAEIFDTPH